MRAGCCGSCREGRDPCTMPGTCGRPVVYRTAAPWWRAPELRGQLLTGAKVVVIVVALAAIALTGR